MAAAESDASAANSPSLALPSCGVGCVRAVLTVDLVSRICLNCPSAFFSGRCTIAEPAASASIHAALTAFVGSCKACTRVEGGRLWNMLVYHLAG